MDEGRPDQLLFFAFDLLFLNRQNTAQLPLIERKGRPKRLFKKEVQGLRYNEHVTGDGPRFREHACKLGLEGVISKRADRPYAPGDRGIWVKSKCLNREDFVVVGWTAPEGSRQHIGVLRQPVGRSTLQPSGGEVDVGLRPCSWDSARKCVQNLPFPAPILHTGQLYLPPASSLLMGKQDSRPRADKVNST